MIKYLLSIGLAPITYLVVGIFLLRHFLFFSFFLVLMVHVFSNKFAFEYSGSSLILTSLAAYLPPTILSLDLNGTPWLKKIQ